MTDHEADTRQNWKGMDGATAWHLIERHAEGWEDVGQMMNAWLRANTEELRAEIAHLLLYKPARRTEQKAEPVKRIGPTNFAFYGIVEPESNRPTRICNLRSTFYTAFETASNLDCYFAYEAHGARFAPVWSIFPPLPFCI